VYGYLSLYTCMLSQQRNSSTDCKSAQYCTTTGHPYHSPKLYPGPCSSVGMPEGQTHRWPWPITFRLSYASRKM